MSLPLGGAQRGKEKPSDGLDELDDLLHQRSAIRVVDRAAAAADITIHSEEG
jgi:hypothetical protein